METRLYFQQLPFCNYSWKILSSLCILTSICCWIDRFIKGREIRCAVVHSIAKGEVRALSCLEYQVNQDDIRTTEEKYHLNDKGLPAGE